SRSATTTPRGTARDRIDRGRASPVGGPPSISDRAAAAGPRATGVVVVAPRRLGRRVRSADTRRRGGQRRVPGRQRGVGHARAATGGGRRLPRRRPQGDRGARGGAARARGRAGRTADVAGRRPASRAAARGSPTGTPGR